MVTPAAPQSERENVIPLINIVFLLLIFFMIAGQMTQPEVLEVTPPDVKKNDGTPNLAAKLLVDKKGALIHGNKKVALIDLPTLINKDSPITLKIDKDCKRDCFLPVLHTLQEAGQQRVHLVTLLAPAGS